MRTNPSDAPDSPYDFLFLSQSKGHKQHDDQGLDPDKETQTAASSRQRMPCQTHHLQHVHQKQTILGPESLSAIHFPKMSAVG